MTTNTHSTAAHGGREGVGMKYGSVCSGIEAATVAWHPLGWSPQWFAEIEAFPSAVLKHHYPSVPNKGDFTKIGVADEPIELLVGGTPCQSFSVAGKRLGMDDARGNLAIEFLRLAERMRPRWVVFENVPGLLSSDNGRDFHAFLSLLGECGYGYAYRVLDAQYFGVAQRRRRVFVVGYLGDWRPTTAVLLESTSLSRHPAPRRTKGERVADHLTVGANQYSGFCGEPVEVARTDSTRNQRLNATDETLIPTLSYALRAGAGAPHPDAHDVTLLVAPTLEAQGCATGQELARSGAVVFNWQSGQNVSITEEQAGTVIRNQVQANGLHQQAREYQGDRLIDANNGLWPTLPSQGANNGGGAGARLHQHLSVRRLTPRECERLQGFPDDYTFIPYQGKQAQDGPRYKALGNSMAVPCMAWIGRRIDMVDKVIAAIERERAA